MLIDNLIQAALYCQPLSGCSWPVMMSVICVNSTLFAACGSVSAACRSVPGDCD